MLVGLGRWLRIVGYDTATAGKGATRRSLVTAHSGFRLIVGAFRLVSPVCCARYSVATHLRIELALGLNGVAMATGKTMGGESEADYRRLMSDLARRPKAGTRVLAKGPPTDGGKPCLAA